MAPVEVNCGGYVFVVGSGRNKQILGPMDEPIGTVHGYEEGGAVSLNSGIEPDEVSGGVIQEDRGGKSFYKIPPGEMVKIERVILTGKK